MEKYGADENIAIGDSVTDLNMALHTPEPIPLIKFFESKYE